MLLPAIKVAKKGEAKAKYARSLADETTGPSIMLLCRMIIMGLAVTASL